MKKYIADKLKWGIVLGVLGGLILLPRIFDLDQFITADEPRWQANVTGFVTKLGAGDLSHLLRQPHPGLTTQWLAAPTYFNESWAIRKLPLVLTQSALVAATAYVFVRLGGLALGLTLALLLALNPLLIAHTRVYAMDALLAIFLLLSAGLLLLWLKSRDWFYLALAGVAGAGAWLSKLPGIIIVPFSAVVLLCWRWPAIITRGWRSKQIWWWGLMFAIASVLILPQLALAPVATLGDFGELFRSDEYLLVHQEPATYYLETLLLFSTPLHFLSLILLPFIWRMNARRRPLSPGAIVSLISLASLFFIAMAVATKKGDRYLLPVFVIWDVLAATVIVAVWRARSATKNLWWRFVRLGLVGLIALQGWQLLMLHPYYLAYVNPLTRPWLGERRLGWGEGLDIAAEYLNQKPGADRLNVATYYPTLFSHRFRGRVTAAHQYDHAGIDYIVTYRAMWNRPQSWESDVLTALAKHTPEKIISLGGIPYVWIYAAPLPASPSSSQN